MSWYVEALLRSRNEIRNRIVKDIYISDENGGPSQLLDFNDSTYDDLLTVESTVYKLAKNNRFSSSEAIVLNSIIEEGSFDKAQRELKVSFLTCKKIFIRTCRKIAFILGGYFTDVGYMEYMRQKYKLTEFQFNKMKNYIDNTNKKHFRNRRKQN